MALKRSTDETVVDVPIAESKAKNLFNNNSSPKKETMILTTFSIAPSFKKELEEMFADMGIGWAAGIRFALKEFYKKHQE
ncbi:MAG: hypothetical protein K5634_06115 [Sphaerochaetaceae bacterium]|nr:hypothetical protein [Sphaerochaetaceae bacterium]